MLDVVTFGEAMVVMVPEQPGSLEQVERFRKDIAGAESNVAIGLARLGHHVAWVSRLGDDGFGRFIYKKLRGEGIDVSKVQFDEVRPTGVYFKEFTPGGRARVYYYRSGSAASALSARDIPWDYFGDAKYLFLTGITPALSTTCRDAVYRSIEVAHERGLTVVFDPNVRLKLWSADEARKVLSDLAERCDIVLPGSDEGHLITGQHEPEMMAEAFLHGRTKLVVVKLGAKGAYYRTQVSEGYVNGTPVASMDEVGAGDAFAAGLLSGLLDRLDLQAAVHRACTLGAMAVMQVGDYQSLPTRRELEQLEKGKEEPCR